MTTEQLNRESKQYQHDNHSHYHRHHGRGMSLDDRIAERESLMAIKRKREDMVKNSNKTNKKKSEEERLNETAWLVDFCEENNFEGAEILEKYSLPELAKMFNGVGPEWMDEKGREVLDKHLELFMPAVFLHDVMYTVYEDRSQDGFCYTNNAFLANCSKCVGMKYKPTQLKFYKGILTAFLLWRAVDRCGWKAWKEGFICG